MRWPKYWLPCRCHRDAEMRINPALTVGVLGSAVIGIGRVFGLIEMYVIGTGLIVAAILGVVTTRTRIVLVEVERRPTMAEPRVGEEVGIELTVRALRRSPGFELTDRIADSAASSIGRVDVSVPSLRRSQHTVTRYRVRAEMRGVITLGPALVEFGDPLGLARRSRPVGISHELIVSPDWVSIALPHPRQCEGELVTAIEQITRTRSADLEFRSMREYAPGDDVRFVNWRASARRDALIVNEYESHAGILLDVFLDDSLACYTPEGFERAVSVAASFVGSANLSVEDGIRVRLSFGDRARRTAFDTEISETTRREAMRSLAVVELGHHEPEVRSAGERSRVTIPVMICGRRNPEWLDRTHRALDGSNVVVVIACEGASSLSTPQGWFMIDLLDFRDFSGRWASLSRRVMTS